MLLWLSGLRHRSLDNDLCLSSLVQGVVPNDWREANITALFKKGSKSASQNYRPVSLTSVICKQIESIIKDEIIKHLNIFNIQVLYIFNIFNI